VIGGDFVKAAIVREFGRPPTYGDFDDPAPNPGESTISVTAAAVSTLTRSSAAGRHYSNASELPLVPGIDGIGRTSDGRRVYFVLPRPPFGSLAERSVVSTSRLIPLPDDLDDTTAAAAANPGMSCWVPLTRHAHIRPGESVLVNGGNGVSGRIAIQVAKHLGARRVIATGRDEAKLRSLAALGADVVIPTGQPAGAFRDAVRQAAADSEIGIVVDYLWGPTAEALIDALGGPRAPRGASRIRYIQVGSLAGPTISLDSSKLRSSGLEILGSGIGSTTERDLVNGIAEFLAAFRPAGFRIATEVHPLSEVERAWDTAAPEKRPVFTIP
jgi:NADPH:quinone reductase-like Zn-dependent oxidoreductase